MGVSACNTSDEGAKQGTATAESCSESDLIAQCPPNTFPDLESDAVSSCSMSGSIDASQDVDTIEGGAAINTACVGSGSCKVVCRLEVPCTYGVERISPTDGIICSAPPAGCGNGECDQGETPESCPIDCGMTCAPGSARCMGDAVQSCTPRGTWDEPIECSRGSRCLVVDESASCSSPSCGDGVVDLEEECDPNAEDEVECDMNCTRPRCGNGVRGFDANGEAEECDDGNYDNSDNCTAACALARCGDGYIQDGEGCDDGNEDNSDLCDNSCQLGTPCGNGVIDAGEACDDGNTSNEDGCLTTCVLNTCGDGYIHVGVESCDDGNNEDGDQCTQSCLIARCGDGVTQVGIEECDDGNQVNDDQCTNMCTAPRCGDQLIQAGEGCDDGNMTNDDACLNDCLLPRCGDGYLYAEEESCDDQNQVDSDRCLSTCELAACGDGIRRADISLGAEGFEYCDDGNEAEFDGCNSTCVQTEIEPNDTAGRIGDVSTDNMIMYDKIVGVMEGAPSASGMSADTFVFELNCGVGEGVCPPNSSVTWHFTLSAPNEICKTYTREIGCNLPRCRVCIDRGFQVIPSCNGLCEADDIPTLTWGRLGSTVSWSVTADMGGIWEFQLQNFHTAAFNYTLRVSESQ